MRFAPRIDIISLLVQILSNFEKSHFLEFSFVGFQHFDARRIFYGCRNGRLLSGTPPNTLGLFPKKMEDNNSTLFGTYTKIPAQLPVRQKQYNVHISA